MAACTFACGSKGGSSSTPTSPSTPSTPSTPATPTGPAVSTSGVFTFSFDAGTNASEQQMIKDEVLFAQSFFQTTFNRTVQQSTNVNGVLSGTGCSQGGAAAFTAPGVLTFCMGNPGWTQNPPINKQKIVVHELFHVMQYEMKWIGTPTAGAHWIIEGSAELVGFRGVASQNLLPYDTSVSCMVKQVADFARTSPPGLPNLNAVESAQAFQTTTGPLYAEAMIGMDQLTKTPGIGAIMTYGNAIAGGTQYPNAFSNTFGSPPIVFYGQFPTYLANLPVPATYVCGV